MQLTRPLTRTRFLVALAAAVALVVSGCTVQARPVTNVTSSSATLNAEVSCGSGSVWWELREAGQSKWTAVGVDPTVTCPRGVGGAPPPTTARISEPVGGLRSNASYEFRVGVDPPGEIGVVYATASRFTPAAAPGRSWCPRRAARRPRCGPARAPGPAFSCAE
jgi:hypothetical protein